jgi:hypothetical protein
MNNLETLNGEERTINNNIFVLQTNKRTLRTTIDNLHRELINQQTQEEQYYQREGYRVQYSDDTIRKQREIQNMYNSIDSINEDIEQQRRLLEETQINILFYERLEDNREHRINNLNDIATTALETINQSGDEQADPFGMSTIRRFDMGEGQLVKSKRKKHKQAKTKKKHKNKKNSKAKGIFSKIRKSITNRFRRPHPMVQYSQEVLDQKLLDAALYGESPAEVRKLIHLGANPNITMYDNKVRDERSVIRIAHDNNYDYIVNILREHGVAESLPLRDRTKFSRVSSIKPKSRRKSRKSRKSGKSVHFGIDSIRSIPKIGIHQTPTRNCATRVNMSKERREELELLLQRARLAELRGH